eukprot:1059630-Amphidinium_carterae.1
MGFAAEDNQPVYGRWHVPLTVEAALRSWQIGSVLMPPVQKASFNYQIVVFDACPSRENYD